MAGGVTSIRLASSVIVIDCSSRSCFKRDPKLAAVFVLVLDTWKFHFYM